MHKPDYTMGITSGGEGYFRFTLCHLWGVLLSSPFVVPKGLLIHYIWLNMYIFLHPPVSCLSFAAFSFIVVHRTEHNVLWALEVFSLSYKVSLSSVSPIFI